MPFLAQWNTITLYPPSLIWILLPLPWSLNFFCLLHLLAGGVGMYRLAHDWLKEAFPAAFAGVLFALSGVTISSLVWPHSLAALALMPWVVLWSERAWREGGGAILAGGVLAALQLMTGSPEILILTWLFVLSDGALALAARGTRPGPLARRLGGVMVVASGLSAAQLLPFLDLLAHSQRNPSYATGRWSLPLWGVANFFAPLIHNFSTPQGLLVHGGQAFLPSYYLGLGTIALGQVALWRARSPKVWLLAGSIAFALLISLGVNASIYPTLRSWLPFIGFVRYPVKGLFLAAFAAPLLSAYGLDWCLRRGRQERGRFLRTLLVVLAVTVGAVLTALGYAAAHPSPYDQPGIGASNAAQRLVLLGLILYLLVREPLALTAGGKGMLRLGILLLAALDLSTHHPGLVPTVPSGVLSEPLAESGPNLQPRPEPGISRVLISPRAEHELLFSTTSGLVEDFSEKRSCLWSNLHLLEGVPKAGGTSALVLREEADVSALLAVDDIGRMAGLLDALAVSHILTPGPPRIWQRRSTMVPWLSAGQAPVFAADEEILRALQDPSFDPRSIVYLPLEARSLVSATGPAHASVEIDRFAAEERTVRVSADAPTILVISESYFHPWHATVDGSRVGVLRANHAFMAMPVPAGVHLVRMVYRDGLFLLGGSISLSFLVGITVVWWRRRG